MDEGANWNETRRDKREISNVYSHDLQLLQLHCRPSRFDEDSQDVLTSSFEKEDWGFARVFEYRTVRL